ncbi:hypothetical protein [Jonesia quinghaiensis]|uniref:hypothetical protein n=1 Tax=Jonesia quinghaiensis TaxID=262806 RepID=UPI0004192EFE|nr:hypothetical protein [Jonesia quinghaiensis]
MDNHPTPHALERSTRRLWDQWLELLDARACATMPHPGIAQTALELMPEDVDNPQWWAQKVAITYEQHRGLRALGQASDGKFAAQASKTTPLTLDDDARQEWRTWWRDVMAQFAARVKSN